MDLKQEIESALNALKKGGSLLYPTDTIWGIGCDATNFDAVEKIYRLKQRHESKSMICLVSDIDMLKRYVEEIPEVAYDILENATKPTTVIYEKPKRVSENLIADDNTMAIRIVQDEFCKELIKRLKRPLVSTSANISGHSAPTTYKEIHNDILKGVDYVVNLHRDKKSSNPSAIIKLNNDGVIKIIRD